MFDPFSESELLEFIEDQLAPRRVESLRRRLADHPEIEATVERLRADRHQLRSLAEPALPVDFVAELEPQLARAAVATSVAESAPGAYRRRHRRAAHRALRLRYAVAAALLLVVLGATWRALQLVSRPGARATELAERVGTPDLRAPLVARDAPALAFDETAPVEDLPWPPPGRTVHHAAPLPAATTVAASSAQTPPSPLRAEPVVGRFVLVLRAADPDAGERSLEAALAAAGLGGDDVALVRNFSDTEATQMVARLHRRGMLADEPPDAISGVSGGSDDPQRRVRRLAGILRRLSEREVPLEDEMRISRQLLGPKSLAPSYERQLELSGRGATHTLTVRVADVANLVARLYELDATNLRPLETASDEATGLATAQGSALQQWIRDHHEIRVFLDDLRGEHGANGLLMLPVTIESVD